MCYSVLCVRGGEEAAVHGLGGPGCLHALLLCSIRTSVLRVSVELIVMMMMVIMMMATMTMLLLTMTIITMKKKMQTTMTPLITIP